MAAGVQAGLIKVLREDDFVWVGSPIAAAADAANPVKMPWSVNEFRRFVRDLTRYTREGNNIGIKIFSEINSPSCSDAVVSRRMVKYLSSLLKPLHFDKQWMDIREFYIQRRTFPEFDDLFAPIYSFSNFESNEECQDRLNEMETKLYELRERHWSLAKKIAEAKKVLSMVDPDSPESQALKKKLKEFTADLEMGENEQRTRELRLHIFRTAIKERKLDKIIFFTGVGTGLTTSVVSMTALPKLFPALLKIPMENPSDIYSWLMLGGLISGLSLYLGCVELANWLRQSKGVVSPSGTPISAEIPELLEGIVDPNIPIACHFDTKSCGLGGSIIGSIFEKESKTWGEAYIKLGPQSLSYRFDFREECPIALEDLSEMKEIMLDMLEAKTLQPKACLTVLFYLRHGKIGQSDYIGFIDEKYLIEVFDIVVRRAVILLSKEIDIQLTGTQIKPFLTEKEVIEQAEQQYKEITKR